MGAKYPPPPPGGAKKERTRSTKGAYVAEMDERDPSGSP